MSKPGTKFSRHSPDGERISQHIRDTTGDEITLHSDSVICLSCYKLHSYILKMLDSKQEGTDSMLRSMVVTWKAEANGNDAGLLTVALLRTVLFVAEHMLQDKALLLPQTCNIFLQAYGVNYTGSIRAVQLDLDIGDSSVKFSARWLLNQLIIYLSNYMSYQCIHMRIGTILFRTGGNIFASLSYALSTALQTESSLPTVTDFIKPARPKEIREDGNYKKRVLADAAYLVNDLLHDEINKCSTSLETGEDSILLHIDTFLQNVNPLLYQFIVTATKSIRQHQSVAPSICKDSMSVNKHVKKMRHYFILCQLLYCTNPKHPIPIHNILADVVQVCGGSCQLLRILNRLGCTSSPDTHDRFVTFHAETVRGKVYGKSYLEMYSLLPQLITLICYRAILQCFVVIRNEAIMVPPYSLFNQAVLYHLQLLSKTILFVTYVVLTQQQVHILQSVIQMH